MGKLNSIITKRKMDIGEAKDVENAIAGFEKTNIDIEDIVNAVLELGELIAEQEET